MAKIKPGVLVTVSEESILIEIDGCMHLLIERDHFVGLQSWIERSKSNYVIEYTLKYDTTIISEYKSAAMFEAILSQLKEKM